MLVLHFYNPETGKDIMYKVVLEAEVFDREPGHKTREFPLTSITKTSPEITKLAYDITAGLDGMGEIFRLTEFVHKFVRYDEECVNMTGSAVWTFKNRRGTCDEFSSLLIAMLREAGYSANSVSYTHLTLPTKA